MDLYPYEGMDFKGDFNLLVPLVGHLWGPQGMYVCLHACSSLFILTHSILFGMIEAF